jgi:transposase
MSVEQGRVCILPWVRGIVEPMLRRTDLTPRVRERLEMVKAAALGQDMGGIARWSGRSARTVGYWLERFAQGGVAAVGDAPRPGRPPRADGAYHAALERAMGTSPRALGLAYDGWTSARLSAYLEQQTGARVAPSWVRTLLKRHDFVRGRPKHTLKQRQDAVEVAACEVVLAATEKNRGRRAGAL